MYPEKKICQIEGIVLKSFPFKENDRILTLFSPEGILKFFVKGSKKTLLPLLPLVTPFTVAEYFYLPREGGLHRFQEGSLLQQNLAIRDRFATLEAAEEMAQALIRSQLTGKPAPHLYQLFRLCLEALSHAPLPALIASTFLVKTLKHEGALSLSSHCSLCQKPLIERVFRYGGERRCSSHAPPEALFTTIEEEACITQLAHLRSFAELPTLITEGCLKTIRTLFKQTYSETF